MDSYPGWGHILYPGVQGFFEELEYFHGDIGRVLSKVAATPVRAEALGHNSPGSEEGRICREAGMENRRSGFLYPLVARILILA